MERGTLGSSSPGGWCRRLQKEQGDDVILNLVWEWVIAGRHPDWTSKAYYSHWASLSLDNGLLYRSWQAPEGGRPVLKLLVPSIFMPRYSGWSMARWGWSTSGSPRHCRDSRPVSIGQTATKRWSCLSTGVSCVQYRRVLPSAPTPHCNSTRWGPPWSMWGSTSWALLQ